MVNAENSRSRCEKNLNHGEKRLTQMENGVLESLIYTEKA